MWKLIFNSTTNRGVAANRDPHDGEFSVDLHPSQCAWFMSEPERYQCVAGVFLEVDPAILASEKKERDKAAMWEKIKAEREARYNSGVLVGGYWFHTDGYSRIQHLGLKDEVKDTTGVDTDSIVIDSEALVWKTMSGAFVPLTRKLVQDIVKAVKVLDKRLFKAAEIHRVTMEARTDPAAYDYSTGWPESYENITV